MMEGRFVTLFVLVFIGLALVVAQDMENVKMIGQKCAEKFGINKDEFMKEVKEYRFPDDDNTKCALACFMEQTTIMRDLKLNLPVVMAMNKMKFDNPDIIAQGDKIALECDAMINANGETNNCQQGYNIAKCMIDKAEKINFPIHEGH